MSYHIVLIEPEIPNNTGNIGRICLATNSTLHLVKPFGFEIDDKRLKRAGLDYWKHINLKIYASKEDFFKQNKDGKMVFLSSHGEKSHWEIEFEDEMFLIFGKESVGLPKELIKKNKKDLFKIPLYNEQIRSLNLANSVGIIIYEGLRQLK